MSESGREHFEHALVDRSFGKLNKLVAGGSTRAESVRNGLENVDPSCEVVAVHDGARPLVTVEEIERTIRVADQAGAACLVAEVTDTIKKIDGPMIRGTVARATLRRALTPQAFRLDILRRAFAPTELDQNITDECYLVEKLGIDIVCVEGSLRNIKITREDDLRVAEALLTASR